LLESIDIQGSIEDKERIKPSSTLRLFLDFVFMAKGTAISPCDTTA